MSQSMRSGRTGAAIDGAGHVEDLILGWAGDYGYLAVFGLLMFGIVGLPVPDEVVLMFAGFLVSKGDLQLLPTLAAAVLGSACGITVNYGIGRIAGKRLTDRHGRWLRLSEGSLDRVRDWFSRVGKWGLTFGYFLPAVRHLMAVVAGSSRLSLKTFATFAYAGSLLWCSSFVLLGYLTGKEWRGVLRTFHRQVFLVMILLLIMGGAYLLVRRRWRH